MFLGEHIFTSFALDWRWRRTAVCINYVSEHMLKLAMRTVLVLREGSKRNSKQICCHPSVQPLTANNDIELSSVIKCIKRLINVDFNTDEICIESSVGKDTQQQPSNDLVTTVKM